MPARPTGAVNRPTNTGSCESPKQLLRCGALSLMIESSPEAGAVPEVAIVARTSSRRWKGCQLCKPYKHAGHGDAERKPTAELRQIGKRRRVTRHDLGDAEER